MSLKRWSSWTLEGRQCESDVKSCNTDTIMVDSKYWDLTNQPTLDTDVHLAEVHVVGRGKLYDDVSGRR